MLVSTCRVLGLCIIKNDRYVNGIILEDIIYNYCVVKYIISVCTIVSCQNVFRMPSTKKV